MKSGTALVIRAVDEVCVSLSAFAAVEEEDDDSEVVDEPGVRVSDASVLVSNSIGFSAETRNTQHTNIRVARDPNPPKLNNP
jgi:hypothetical protein